MTLSEGPEVSCPTSMRFINCAGSGSAMMQRNSHRSSSGAISAADSGPEGGGGGGRIGGYAGATGPSGGGKGSSKRNGGTEMDTDGSNVAEIDRVSALRREVGPSVIQRKPLFD